MSTLFLAAGIVYAAAVVLLAVSSIAPVGRFRRAGERSLPEDPPEVVVVAAARNEAEHLPAFLAALDAQDYPEGRLTFVVVDDASTDDTHRILRGFHARRHTFEHLQAFHDPSAGSPKKAALTRGIARTRAPLILLTDADTRPAPTWVRRMAGALAGGCPVVAGHSPSEPRAGALASAARLWELGSAVLSAGFIGLGLPVHVTGRNWGFHRRLFEEVGGWSGLEDALSGDDTLLAQKMAEVAPASAWGFALRPDAQVPTVPPTGWSHFLGQRHRQMATGRRFRPGAFLMAALGGLDLFVLWVAALSLFWGTFGAGAWQGPLFKVLADTAVLAVAAGVSRQPDLPGGAPFFSVGHLLLFPLLQIAGLLLPVRWKGRIG